MGIAFVLFLFGTLIHYLLFLVADGLWDGLGSKGWFVPGAIFGGVHLLLCAVPGMTFFAQPLCAMVIQAFSLGIAFGIRKSQGPKYILFLLLYFGVTQLSKGALWPSFAAGAAICLVLAFGPNGQDPGISRVTVSWGERTLSVNALYDTGNTLRDPISGRKVMILGADAANQLLGLDVKALSDPMQTLLARPQDRLRLIPYHSVGGRGLLLAIRPDRVEVDGNRVDTMVAFSPERIGDHRFEALLGGCV